MDFMLSFTHIVLYAEQANHGEHEELASGCSTASKGPGH